MCVAWRGVYEQKKRKAYKKSRFKKKLKRCLINRDLMKI